MAANEDTTVARRTSLRPEAERVLPSLLVLSGPTMGRAYQLTSNSLLIGRADDADVIIDDESVSRHHAKIIRLPHDVFMVKDLGSRNGTFVNQAAIEAHPLSEGDQIQVGDIALKFAVEDSIEAALRDRLYAAAMRDPLTNVYNRRAFDEQIVRALAFSRRHQQPLSLVLLDVDHFKKVNDTHGHPVGDLVLEELAKILGSTLRTEDFLARSGGEEFVIICAGNRRMQAVVLAERLLNAVRGHTFKIPSGPALRVTISAGVAEFSPDSPLQPDQLLSEADQQLYRAKCEGRDRVQPSRQ
jgi:two-component system, cell cycle response regulator